ncbi:MAG: hypothetical protein WD690_20440 [Vicinamibacterales bacterium]
MGRRAVNEQLDVVGFTTAEESAGEHHRRLTKTLGRKYVESWQKSQKGRKILYGQTINVGPSQNGGGYRTFITRNRASFCGDNHLRAKHRWRICLRVRARRER